jgi:hypothetical protein
MKQMTLATGTCEPFRKHTKHRRFLGEMNRAVP